MDRQVRPDRRRELQKRARQRGENCRRERRSRPYCALRKGRPGRLGTGASAARSQPYYLDVTHPDANKGTVVTTLSKLLSVPAREIATIGDMPNDVLMFRKSGLGIAMGNASPDVQAQADVVTASYDDEGFAKAIEQFILHGVPLPLAEAQ